MHLFVLDAKKDLDFKRKLVRISGNYRHGFSFIDISACLKELRESMVMMPDHFEADASDAPMGDFLSIHVLSI